MRKLLGIFPITALILAGCAPLIVTAPPPPSGRVVWNNPGYYGSPPSSGIVTFGNVSVAGNLCSGKVTLTRGLATVTDPCFNRDAVVICTDTTAAKPLRCTPDEGILSVSGSDGDVISYARAK